jgi:arylsulfatase A-like enzyme
MLTGRHPATTGVLGNRTYFRDAHPDSVTLPQLFKQNGYASLRAGKIFHGGIDDVESWTEGGEPRGTPGEADARDLLFRPPTFMAQVRWPNNRPPAEERQMTQAQRSDRWIVLEGDGEGFGDHNTANRAIEFLRKHKDKPFFLGCGFSKPHSPPTAPQRFYDLYDLERIPLPPDFAPRPTVPEGFPRGSIRARNADLFIGRDATPQAAKEMIRAYLASTSWMDWNVGRVLKELDALGLRERTVIVFWGDHGYQLGEKGKWSKAGSLWEQGTRTPFIVLAPGAKGNGKPSQRVVQAIDFYPTLAELCGLPIPKGVEGRSLVPLLTHPDTEWNHPAFTVWSEDGRTYTGVAVRTERWRYAEFDGGRGGAMLLDPKADPHEMRNLVDDPQHAAAKAELSTLVRAYSAKLSAQ